MSHKSIFVFQIYKMLYLQYTIVCLSYNYVPNLYTLVHKMPHCIKNADNCLSLQWILNILSQSAHQGNSCLSSMRSRVWLPISKNKTKPKIMIDGNYVVCRSFLKEDNNKVCHIHRLLLFGTISPRPGMLFDSILWTGEVFKLESTPWNTTAASATKVTWYSKSIVAISTIFSASWGGVDFTAVSHFLCSFIRINYTCREVLSWYHSNSYSCRLHICLEFVISIIPAATSSTEVLDPSYPREYNQMLPISC